MVQRFTPRAYTLLWTVTIPIFPSFVRQTRRRARLISSAVVSYTSSGFTASARNTHGRTTLHIWSVWKPASATLRCLTATQSTRRGLDPPAGRMEETRMTYSVITGEPIFSPRELLDFSLRAAELSNSSAKEIFDDLRYLLGS